MRYIVRQTKDGRFCVYDSFFRQELCRSKHERTCQTIAGHYNENERIAPKYVTGFREFFNHDHYLRVIEARRFSERV